MKKGLLRRFVGWAFGFGRFDYGCDTGERVKTPLPYPRAVMDIKTGKWGTKLPNGEIRPWHPDLADDSLSVTDPDIAGDDYVDFPKPFELLDHETGLWRMTDGSTRLLVDTAGITPPDKWAVDSVRPKLVQSEYDNWFWLLRDGSMVSEHLALGIASPKNIFTKSPCYLTGIDCGNLAMATDERGEKRYAKNCLECSIYKQRSFGEEVEVDVKIDIEYPFNGELSPEDIIGFDLRCTVAGCDDRCKNDAFCAECVFFWSDHLGEKLLGHTARYDFERDHGDMELWDNDYPGSEVREMIRWSLNNPSVVLEYDPTYKIINKIEKLAGHPLSDHAKRYIKQSLGIGEEIIPIPNETLCPCVFSPAINDISDIQITFQDPKFAEKQRLDTLEAIERHLQQIDSDKDTIWFLKDEPIGERFSDFVNRTKNIPASFPRTTCRSAKTSSKQSDHMAGDIPVSEPSADVTGRSDFDGYTGGIL